MTLLLAMAPQPVLARPLERKADAGGLPGGAAASLYSRYSPSVGVVSVIGPVSHHASLLAQFFNGVIATGDVIAALDRAANDATVTTVVLEIDSPGGTVAGIADLRAAVLRLKASGKRVVAAVHESMISASYYAYSAADEIVATATAHGGGLGVYVVVTDSSEAARGEGYRVVPVYARGVTAKPAGKEGVPVTNEQLAGLQRLVDVGQQEMQAAILADRPQVDPAVFDGRILAASDLLAAGLIDRITDYWSLLAELSGQDGSGPAPVTRPPAAVAPEPDDNETPDNEEPTPMDKTAPASPRTAATITELRSAFANDPAFALAAAEKGLSLLEAKAEYADVLRARNDELQAKLNAPAPVAAASPATAPAPSTAPKAAIRPTVPVLNAAAPESAAVHASADRFESTAEGFAARIEACLQSPEAKGARPLAIALAKRADRAGFEAFRRQHHGNVA